MGYFLADKTSTYHYDQVGSTAALTADDGVTVTDRFEYSPYGVLTHRTGETDTPFQYNGRYGIQTDDNGLLHMRARYYSPTLRRFLNADPIGFDGGLNWYAYANGNPVMYVDPSGLDAYIDVGFTKIDSASIVHHTFTLITDSETGSQYVTRAGPSIFDSGEWNGNPMGYLEPNNNAYAKHEFDTPSNTIHRQPIGVVYADFADVVAAADNFAQVTRRNNITYSPIGRGVVGYNSNSYSGTFIESLGFKRPVPDLSSPGFSNGRPSSRLPYGNFQNIDYNNFNFNNTSSQNFTSGGKPK